MIHLKASQKITADFLHVINLRHLISDWHVHHKIFLFYVVELVSVMEGWCYFCKIVPCRIGSLFDRNNLFPLIHLNPLPTLNYQLSSSISYHWPFHYYRPSHLAKNLHLSDHQDPIRHKQFLMCNLSSLITVIDNFVPLDLACKADALWRNYLKRALLPQKRIHQFYHLVFLVRLYLFGKIYNQLDHNWMGALLLLINYHSTYLLY